MNNYAIGLIALFSIVIIALLCGLSFKAGYKDAIKELDRNRPLAGKLIIDKAAQQSYISVDPKIVLNSKNGSEIILMIQEGNVRND